MFWPFKRRVKKLTLPITRSKEETPFTIYEILTDDQKRRYQRDRFVSPIFGKHVKDDVVVPIMVRTQMDMDKLDPFRTKPRLNAEERTRKYGSEYPEFDIIRGKSLDEVLASQHDYEHSRKQAKKPPLSTSPYENEVRKEPVQKPYSPPQPPKVEPTYDPEPVFSPPPSREKAVEEKVVSTSSKKPYEYPPISLFKIPKREVVDVTESLRRQQTIIDQTFVDFGVGAHVHATTQGPTVTRFEVVLESGVRISKVTQLADNLKMNLSAEQIRLEAPIPGKSTVGIEVPNEKRQTVHFYDLLHHPNFKEATDPLTVALGLDIDGEVIVASIKAMPHGLVAGQTGSGKSVNINTLLISLLLNYSPDDLKLILIDPKMVELTAYQALPHLLTPVITDAKAATAALKWAVDEMERRFKMFADHHVRDIEGLNQLRGDVMPYIVIVVDELADLIMVASQAVEESIMRITQKARAAGIHLIVATQRPSTDVIKGTIKSNIPTRIAFSVASHIDSQTILDSAGAEKLIGKGDMLLLTNGKGKRRLQGAYVSDEDIDSVTKFIRDQRAVDYLFSAEELMEKAVNTFENDNLLIDVARFVIEQQECSINKIIKMFSIGFNRAQSIVTSLEAAGIVGDNQGSRAREVLVDEDTSTEIIERMSGL